MESPPVKVGFPEGRIVPGLCAEGPRTLCPQGESRRAEKVKSSKETVENSVVQVLYIQLVTMRHRASLLTDLLPQPHQSPKIGKSPLLRWVCLIGRAAGSPIAPPGQRLSRVTISSPAAARLRIP